MACTLSDQHHCEADSKDSSALTTPVGFMPSALTAWSTSELVYMLACLLTDDCLSPTTDAGPAQIEYLQ